VSRAAISVFSLFQAAADVLFATADLVAVVEDLVQIEEGDSRSLSTRAALYARSWPEVGVRSNPVLAPE